MLTVSVCIVTRVLCFLCFNGCSYAFAAGTTDGPGMFGFHQGTTTGNPFWDKVAAVLSKPTEEEVECQAPKPILLNTGTAAAL